MSRMIIVLLVLSAGGLFGAAPAYSILPIPQDSGFSGFINLGTGAITAKSNTIAGNNLATIGKERIDSLNGSPDSEMDGWADPYVVGLKQALGVPPFVFSHVVGIPATKHSKMRLSSAAITRQGRSTRTPDWAPYRPALSGRRP